MYAQDIHVPGMKFAVVARPPVVLGQVKTFDEAAAMKVPGVVKVVKIPSHAHARRVRSPGWRRRHREQHLGGDQGT